MFLSIWKEIDINKKSLFTHHKLPKILQSYTKKKLPTILFANIVFVCNSTVFIPIEKYSINETLEFTASVGVFHIVCCISQVINTKKKSS